MPNTVWIYLHALTCQHMHSTRPLYTCALVSGTPTLAAQPEILQVPRKGIQWSDCTSHNFSIGLRYGEFGGQANTLNTRCSSYYSWTVFALLQDALYFWKRPLPAGLRQIDGCYMNGKTQALPAEHCPKHFLHCLTTSCVNPGATYFPGNWCTLT